MKIEPERLTGKAIRRGGERVGRNPTPPSLRRGQLHGFPQPHSLGAPKRSDGGTPSSDSEIRCVSHKVTQGSQSGAYRLMTIRAVGPDCIALPVRGEATPAIGSQ